MDLLKVCYGIFELKFLKIFVNVIFEKKIEKLLKV